MIYVKSIKVTGERKVYKIAMSKESRIKNDISAHEYFIEEWKLFNSLKNRALKNNHSKK